MTNRAERSGSIVNIVYPYGSSLFIHVPDVGGKLPLIVHLAPNDDILAVDHFGCIAFSLEAERADLARGIRPERLHVDRCQPAIAELLHRIVPEALDGLPSVHHLATGGKNIGILGVQLSHRMGIALVERFGP